MTAPNKTGKRVQFHELWKKDSMVIIIPKIQRDFAYGRANNTTNRTRFLDKIIKSVIPGSNTEIELDFVFGRLDQNSVPHVFEPIDGQQRLTILFLLYLYVGKRSGKTSTELEFLEKFSYETRDSSNEFCNKLVAISPRYFNGTNDYKSIVDYVQDQWWYNSVWSADPTIASMLVMLGDIHLRLKDYSDTDMQDVWDAMCRNIYFWLITLDDLNTTDTLYIKMNSRGKSLNDFEHFKAELDRYTDSSEISSKIDSVWTNLLWQYRATKDHIDETNVDSEKYTENALNELFYNLFYRFLTIEGCKMGLFEYPKDSDYGNEPLLELAEKVLTKHPNAIQRLKTILDFLDSQLTVEDFFNRFITTKYVKTTEDVFTTENDYRVYIGEITDFLKIATGCDVSLSNTLFLEAFFEFIYRKASANSKTDNEEIIDIPEADFIDRLRILRNLQNNLQIHNYEMKDLLNRTDRIVCLGDLFEGDIKDAYTSLQKNQEVFKLNWKTSHSREDWLLLKSLENTWYLYGNLSPLMVVNNTLEIKYMIGFLHYFSVESNLLNLKRQALLAAGDYATINQGLKRYARADNDLSWYNQIFIFANTNFAPTFGKLVDDLDKQKLSIQQYVDNYIYKSISQSRYDWRYYLILYSEIYYNPVDGSKSGMFRIGNGRYDYLTVMGTRGRSWNPYLLALATKLPGSTLGDWDSPLLYKGNEIRFSERHITIKYPWGVIRQIEIPSSYEGIDTVDRIQFTYEMLTGNRQRDKNIKTRKKGLLKKKTNRNLRFLKSKR